MRTSHSLIKKIALPVSTILIIAAVCFTPSSFGQESENEFIVYNVFTDLNMGNPGEKSHRDFFINLGARNGLKLGETVRVYRRMATYNLVSKKLHNDMILPFAELKVIHVENASAIARLHRFLPEDLTPTVQPKAVMVGDLVARTGG